MKRSRDWFAIVALLSSFNEALADDAMPAVQATFVQAVQIVQDLAKTAVNDMQKGGLRARREKILCGLLPDFAANDWTGVVYSVGANGDGKGTLEIEIAPDVYVMTWNNFLSDAFDKTLIEPGTLTFDQASRLSKGQKVRFSGHFISAGWGETVTCLREGSLTLDGKISEPEFIFRFDAIAPR